MAYPVREVAILLNVSDRTVWRMLRDGQIARVNYPGRRCTRIPASEVDRLLRPTRERAPARPTVSADVLRMAREMRAQMRG